MREKLFLKMSEKLISEVFDLTIEPVHDRWGHLVRELQVEAILPKADNFCRAVQEKGASLDGCWGYLDGTVRPIARPRRMQRVHSERRKKKDAMKH